ncbi:hypothetical protein COX84_01345, partial [Candidatus Micrarchaeota archaeon CG_4_10_14_0_2_um_filter_49_7]
LKFLSPINDQFSFIATVDLMDKDNLDPSIAREHTVQAFGQDWYKIPGTNPVEQSGNNCYLPDYGKLLDYGVVDPSNSNVGRQQIQVIDNVRVPVGAPEVLPGSFISVLAPSGVRNLGFRLDEPLLVSSFWTTLLETTEGVGAGAQLSQSGTLAYINPVSGGYEISTDNNIDGFGHNGVIGLPVQLTTNGLQGGLPFGYGTQLWGPEVPNVPEMSGFQVVKTNDQNVILSIPGEQGSIDPATIASLNNLLDTNGIKIGGITYLNLSGNMVNASGGLSLRPLAGAVNPTTGFLPYEEAVFDFNDPADNSVRNAKIESTDGLGLGVLFQAPGNTSERIGVMPINLSTGATLTTTLPSGSNLETSGQLVTLAHLGTGGGIDYSDQKFGDDIIGYDDFRVYDTQV